MIAWDSWLRTLGGCTAYNVPLHSICGQDGTLTASEWRPLKGTVIGPVTEVRVSDVNVVVSVKGWWIQVWWRTRGGQRLGVTFAQQV